QAERARRRCVIFKRDALRAAQRIDEQRKTFGAPAKLDAPRAQLRKISHFAVAEEPRERIESHASSLAFRRRSCAKTAGACAFVPARCCSRVSLSSYFGVVPKPKRRPLPTPCRQRLRPARARRLTSPRSFTPSS